MSKLIILDRDGVINRDSLHYIKSVEEFELLPGSIEAIVQLTQAGFEIAVATNQSGISRGYYDHAILAAIHEKLLTRVYAAGGAIAAIEYCPHLPDVGCACRKPQPGMLLSIANRFNQSLDNVPFIGDRISDIQAAEAAGATPMLILSSMTNREQLSLYSHVPVFDSLLQCVDHVLK